MKVSIASIQLCLVLFFSAFFGTLTAQEFNQRYYYNQADWQDFVKVLPVSDTSLLVVTKSWETTNLDAFPTQISLLNNSGELLSAPRAVNNVLQSIMTIGDINFDADSNVLVGGVIISNNMMVKLDGNSVIENQWLNVDALNNTVNDYMEQTGADEYTIAGHRVQEDYAFITQFDGAGQTDSILKINVGDDFSKIRDMQVVRSKTNGFYVIINQTRTDLTTFIDSYFSILRLDDDLSELWNKSYSVLSTNDYAEVYGLMETDEGFVTVGRHNDAITFLEFDAEGVNQFAKEYVVGDNEQAGWGMDIIPDNAGGYLVATGVPRPSASVGYQSNILNVDASGNLQWMKRYNPGKLAAFKGLVWQGDELIGFGRLRDNSSNIAFWLNTAIGYEDCNFEMITESVNTTNTLVIENEFPLINVNIAPRTTDDPSLSTKAVGVPEDSSCVYTKDVVYPGDANFNQIANVYDLLPIGVFYDETGPVRPNATTEWNGQWAQDWKVQQIDGADIKHIDATGNGVIDAGDVVAIEENYSLTHASTARSSEIYSRKDGPDLFVNLPESVPQGVELFSEVIYGTEDNPAEEVYGICFVVDYSNSPIPIDSIGFEPNPSWLGTSDSVLYIAKHLSAANRLEVGLVKTTGNNERRAFGSIGKLFIVTEDNVLGRPMNNELVLDIVDVKAISVDESILDVNARSSQVVITDVLDRTLANAIEVFPNPVTDVLHIKAASLNFESIERIELYSSEGRLVKSQEHPQPTMEISTLKSGVYWLKIVRRETYGFIRVIKH